MFTSGKNKYLCRRILIRMDSLKDLLVSKNLDEPSEMTSLRDYLQSAFKFIPNIKASQNAIIVTVSNSKLATEIRARTLDIERRCQLTRKLVVRVGSGGR